MNYQRQNTFVASLRADATALMDKIEIILANGDEYSALGGQMFFNQYFLDAVEDPPLNQADPGITQAEFSAAIVALAALKQLDFDAIYTIKG